MTMFSIPFYPCPSARVCQSTYPSAHIAYIAPLAVFANELGYRVMHSAGGKFRLYDTSGALLGIAASKEAVAKLYRRKVLARERR